MPGFCDRGALAAGVVNWTITGNNSTSAIPTTVIGVNGQYFYIAKVPFETRHIGSDTFSATPNTLQFTASGATCARSATVNGSNAVIAFSRAAIWPRSDSAGQIRAAWSGWTSR